jgi:DNA repair protein RadD
MLRPYQQDAHDKVMDWVKTCVEPCLVEAATGAGKSHIIAAVAESLHRISGGKHILCLAPSAELVLQNREKFLATGNPASIFSASAGGADLRHPVVFGTPMTVLNKIDRFGSRFCAVIVDEAHGVTPTILSIISQIKEHNQHLRVIGLTATPYRMGSGYIYGMDEKGKPISDSEAREPYFEKLLYSIKARTLIDMGFLAEPVVGSISADAYETLDIEVQNNGRFRTDDIERALVGQGRKTSMIIAEVVAKSRERNGVMIFASTVRHARECMDSLPPKLSAIVTGDTKKSERADILRRFKAREIKYLVNVAVLTTGFDATHVDVIALLRPTESAGLLQQIIGRGLRTDSCKSDCLILDYAQNIERHCPDGDVFSPEIIVGKKGGSGGLEVECPACKCVQEFTARPNKDGWKISKHGYFCGLDDQPLTGEFGAIPAHFGRRCQYKAPGPGGKLFQCDYRWTIKECPHCEADNDIAARYCEACEGELVDPNTKLISEYREMKKDPTRMQCDKILKLTTTSSMTRSGKQCIIARFVTTNRDFTVWYLLEDGPPSARARLQLFREATAGGRTPQTVKYKKNHNGFFDTFAFDLPHDVEPGSGE